MKYIIVTIVLTVILFESTNSLSQIHKSKLDITLDTVKVNGYWTRVFFSKPKKGNIDNPSYSFFIECENYKSINLKYVLKNYKLILKNNNSLYLTWKSDASDFFYYYPSSHSKEKWDFEFPLTDCNLYKFKGKYIRTQFCSYMAYRKKVSTNILKNQIMIYQTYFSESDTTDVYLFYKLISKECFKSK